MKILLSNEIFKLKRQFFLLFALFLTILPVITGGMGAIISGGKTYYDLFFFINNQYSMFYPMVVFIIVSTLFYVEYKNKTYITWILYRYRKLTLFGSKILVSMLVSLIMSISLLLIFGGLVLGLNIFSGLEIQNHEILRSLGGFLVETVMIIPVATMMGAIVINLSRNMVISSILGIFYGFFSCLFIGMDYGKFIPGAFSYRICMFILDKDSFYENVRASLMYGWISYFLIATIVFIMAILIFNKKKKIER